jgi:hypothetical protein
MAEWDSSAGEARIDNERGWKHLQVSTLEGALEQIAVLAPSFQLRSQSKTFSAFVSINNII